MKVRPISKTNLYNLLKTHTGPMKELNDEVAICQNECSVLSGIVTGPNARFKYHLSNK